MSPRPLDRRVAVVVAALVVLAVGVRAVPAVHESLWLDEVVSARIIVEPTPAKAVARVRKTESSPPGWHLANWLAWRVAGRPRIELLRLLSVLVGAALTVLTYRFGVSIGIDRWASALAAAIAALGPNVVAHGAELRPYELLTLLSLMLVTSLLAAVERPTPSRLALLGGVVAAGAYTHYFFLLATGICAAWAVWRTSGATRSRLLAALALGTLPFVLWLADFRFQYDHNLYAYNGSFSLQTVAYSFSRIIGIAGASGGVYSALRVLFALAAVAGALLLVRERQTELAGVMAVVPIAATAVIWLLGPHIFNERNLLISMPFIAVGVARLVEELPHRGSLLATAAVIALVGASLWQWELSYGRSDYSQVADTLVRDGWGSGDEIVQFGPAPLGLSQPVGWYLPGHPLLGHARPEQSCATVLAVSYDPGPGARWIDRHRRPGTGSTAFAAFDHSPRGPRAGTPIVVARLRASPGIANLATAAGGAVLSDTRHPRCRTNSR